MHGNLIRGLQERAGRAVPARHIEHADGWVLRHAPGPSWWAGSVLPHAGGDLPGRIAHAERFYASRGATARFQITPGACAAGLDALLEARGYHAHTRVCLQIADTARIPTPATGLRVVVAEGPACAEVSALLDGEVVSRARAVADTGWTGVFGMATVPAAQGLGAARAVLAAIAGWAPTPRLYLQVERDNVAAQALYRRSGFIEICEYHYRSAEAPLPSGR